MEGKCMTNLEFVKHRFAGKIKEIINTYKKYYYDSEPYKDGDPRLYNHLILEGYLNGLLYGTGLKIVSVNNRDEIKHYVIKNNTHETLAEIDFETLMVR